jgi:hypothetical protein
MALMLAKTLKRFGIEAESEEIEQWVSEATEELLREWRPLNPETDLTKAERDELRSGGLTLEKRDYRGEDPVLESATRYAALVSASLSVSQVAELLEVDGSRIRQRLLARSIYGIRLPSGWRVPAFQFEANRLLPGLDIVMPRLPKDLHPLEVLGWFTTPNPDLVVNDASVSPRDWLRLGRDPKAVAELAGDLDYEL